MSTLPNRGILCGQMVAPTRILDGIAPDGGATVIQESPKRRRVHDMMPWRALLIGAFGTGVAFALAYLAYAMALAGRMTIAYAVGFVAAPMLLLAVTGMVLLKIMSLDAETGARSVLVTCDGHLVHIKSYVTDDGIHPQSPLVRIHVTHVEISKGTATRTIGGVTFSQAEQYRLDVALAKSGDVSTGDVSGARISDDCYDGVSALYVPDIFETPLSDLLGGRLDDSSWIWAHSPGDRRRHMATADGSSSVTADANC